MHIKYANKLEWKPTSAAEGILKACYFESEKKLTVVQVLLLATLAHKTFFFFFLI